MITCAEINRFVKAGRRVTARVPGFSGEQQILRARVGLLDTLQVQILIDGERCWRNALYSSIRVEEEQCAKS